MVRQDEIRRDEDGWMKGINNGGNGRDQKERKEKERKGKERIREKGGRKRHRATHDMTIFRVL